jgi:hypothetical protein
VISLLDKSLLKRVDQEGGEPRPVMLETVREYGLEELTASDELERVRDTYAAYYLRLAEDAESALRGAEQGNWAERPEQDRENIRATLQWLVDRHKIEQALRMGTALLQFWLLRGYLSEGRHFLEQALEAGNSERVSVSPTVRAREGRAYQVDAGLVPGRPGRNRPGRGTGCQGGVPVGDGRCRTYNQWHLFHDWERAAFL